MNNKKVAAYIRVSDKNKGDGKAQMNSIKEYADRNDITVDLWITENVSATKTDIADRKFIDLVNDGYSIVMTDISRMGRKGAFDLIGVIGQICNEGGELHLTYTQRVVNSSNMDDAETIFTIVGQSFAAVEEGKRRSERAKAAVNRRSANGLLNGRPRGTKVRSKLDDHAAFIIDELQSNTSKVKIVELLKNKKDCDVSRMQLHRWIDKRLKPTSTPTVN